VAIASASRGFLRVVSGAAVASMVGVIRVVQIVVKGRTMVFPRLHSVFFSEDGSDTTYFSLANYQVPFRQRSLQKGKSAWTAESVSALQMGHLCFIARFFSSL